MTLALNFFFWDSADWDGGSAPPAVVVDLRVTQGGSGGKRRQTEYVPFDEEFWLAREQYLRDMAAQFEKPVVVKAPKSTAAEPQADIPAAKEVAKPVQSAKMLWSEAQLRDAIANAQLAQTREQLELAGAALRKAYEARAAQQKRQEQIAKKNAKNKKLRLLALGLALLLK